MENNSINRMENTGKFDKYADLLLVFSVFLYAYRGNIGAIFAIGSILLRIANGRLVIKRTNGMVLAWACFLSLFAVGLYLVRNLNFEFYVFTAYVSSVVVLILYRHVNYERVFRYMFIGSVVIVMSVFFQYLLPSVYSMVAKLIFPTHVYTQIISRQGIGYVTGFTREVSYAALLILVGLLYVVYVKKEKSKWIYVLVFFTALFLTGKKSQPVFMLLAIAISAYLQTKNLKKHFKIIGGAIVFLTIVVVTFPIWRNISFLSRIVQFIDGLSGGVDLVGLSSGRTVIYERAIQLWKENTLFGIGWNNFRNLGAYGSSEYTTWFQNFDVHNCYLQILCETGIVGAILFGVLLLRTAFLSVIHVRNESNSMKKLTFTYMVFFALYSFTEPCLYTDSYFIIFFLCVGYLFGVREGIKE